MLKSSRSLEEFASAFQGRLLAMHTGSLFGAAGIQPSRMVVAVCSGDRQ